jgi:hypothetical protein
VKSFASFRLDEAEREAKALPPTDAEHESPATPEELSRFDQIAKLSPRAAILEYRVKLEEVLREFAQSVGMKDTTRPFGILVRELRMTLAACGQNPGSVEKGEQGPPGPQGPAGPQGPPGPQGPASQAGGSGLVIHFQQFGCSTSSCTMSCKEGERILNAVAFTPGAYLNIRMSII